MRFRFHHLHVELRGAGPALDAARTLFGGFPSIDASGEADLVVNLRPAAATPRLPSPSDFFHGTIDCHAVGDDVILSDGFSRSRVHGGGRLVEIDVADESLGDLHMFAQVFLLISIVLALRWRHLFHVHAGALVSPSGAGILVTGTAGAGKSTLSLALLEAGCSYLGDDAVFLTVRDDGPVVLSLPRPFHVAPQTIAAFPRIAPFVGSILPNGKKWNLDARATWPGREREEIVAPDVLLLPEVADREETEVQPLGASVGLGALLESSTYVVVDDLPARSAHLDALRRLADGAKAYRVKLGADLLHAPVRTANRILSAVGAETG